MQFRYRPLFLRLFSTFFFVMVLAVASMAQEVVNDRFYRMTLSQALNTIAKKHYLHIAYNPALTDKVTVNVSIVDKTFAEAFTILLRRTTLNAVKVDSRSYIIKEKEAKDNAEPVKRKRRFTISGYVSQEGSGEKLISATVAVKGTSIGTISNEFGFYSLTLEEGAYDVVTSYVGYQTIENKVELKENRQLNISLNGGQRLQEVVIKQVKDNENHIRPQMSLNTLSMDQVKASPVLFGEADVLKTLQLLPGIKSGNEGSSGIYVRGGSPDQNLILLDGVPVYNASHMFGFFSVFNADAINNTKIYKGGFPARYGERLSSVIDVRMKEGNLQKYEGEVAVGLISSKLSVSGPIVKDKTSFIVSARRTYLDMLLKAYSLFSKKDKNEETGEVIPDIYFYDINAKVNHKFSDSDRLYLSLYGGRDVLSSKTKDVYSNSSKSTTDKTYLGIGWGNIIGALRWNHIFSPKLFANTTATYTFYNFDINSEVNKTITNEGDPPLYENSKAKFLSGIRDISGKIDFDYFPSSAHAIKFGGVMTFHTFTPSASNINFASDIDPLIDKKENERETIGAKEMAVYAEDTYSITDYLSVNAGVRASAFVVDGRSYGSVEPRISANIKTSEQSSIKLSYVEMTQYLHFLTSGSMSLPSDLWVPTTAKVKPQHSRQVALGVTQSLGPLSFTLEGYYKRMTNMVEYKDGAYFSQNETSWEDKVAQGKGDGYGAELMIEKQTGKLTGWFSYTLSWANRTFKDLNGGRTFPFSYDKRHDISLSLFYAPSKRIDFGATWVYNTGRAFTLGTESYPSYESDIRGGESVKMISNNNDRNNVRMPSYHRLDLGINFRKKKKWGERTWTLGVYNVYNRHNTFYMYPNEDNGHIRSVTLFTLIPSISYSFKF